jgi:serine/threonine protein kinase
LNLNPEIGIEEVNTHNVNISERSIPAIKSVRDEQGLETVSVDPTNKDESIQVSSEMFEMIKLLGAGTFGKVFVVKCLISSIQEEIEGKTRRVLLKETRKGLSKMGAL